MGYSGKLKEKRQAIKLRKQGLTYSEIKEKINVSKNSISRWCRDIELSDNKLKRIYGKTKKGGLKGSVIAAKNKRRRTKKKIEELTKKGIKDIGNISRRDFFISGVMLYAGEGTKTDGKVSFSNADPLLIKFMIRWFRMFCPINEKKFRAQLYIHDDLDEGNSKKYWSNLTNIPLNQFHKSYIVKNNPNRLHKNIHEFGVLKIAFNDVRIHRRLMGWIKGVVVEK
ncbi:MAG: helix-turn-helix domain-containing protein [Candidatus Paceibacterota bacterium]